MSPLIEEPMNCEPRSHIDVQAAQAYSTRQNPLCINDIAACELVRGCGSRFRFAEVGKQVVLLKN
jgi:hypothetical protein